ncbi:MAG: SLBB domain-containing protein [Alphaproteobacteria bacterium]|nr:SLBB domain-containing protein [Alphaproteobacteria bacterium]
MAQFPLLFRAVFLASLLFLSMSANAFAQTGYARNSSMTAPTTGPTASAQATQAQTAQHPQNTQGMEEEPPCEIQPFGQSLFLNGPAKSSAALMSPKQRVAIGDRIGLAAWGAVEDEQVQSVDSQGFIFIKGVGPVHVAGVPEDKLSAHIQKEIDHVYKDSVQVYARLEQNAGTPVLVTGGVARPGQYYGSAQDNVVVWLQRAGGILAGRGSYRSVKVTQADGKTTTVDLYDFLENGVSPDILWQPGDVITVAAPTLQVAVGGDVRRCGLYEVPAFGAIGLDVLRLAHPLPAATHGLVKGHRDGKPYTKVMPLKDLQNAGLRDGDQIHLHAGQDGGNITVKINGRTSGSTLLAVPEHTMLSRVLDQIQVDPAIADTKSVYIRRASVAKMQKQAMDESLNRLLQSALTAPAQSDGEALIRAHEAQLIEEFVSRVKNVQPEGRVVVMQAGKFHDLPLEDGDEIIIPQKTNVVSIEGEVVLPRTVVLHDGADVDDYIRMAGGFTERAQKRDFVVIHPNGDALRSGDPEIHAGDRLLILPRVDTKAMQTTKDIVQILYQIAVGAGVLLTID